MYDKLCVFICNHVTYVFAKIFDKEQDNLYCEPVVTAAVLSAAIGCAVSMLPEPQASLLWKPVLKRAEEALDLLQLAMNSNLSAHHKNSAKGLVRLGGPCFYPEVFCFSFCSLRAAGEIARTGRPSLLLFEALRVTQRKASAFIASISKCDGQEKDQHGSRSEDGSMRISSGENDRSVIVHPKIYQLVKSLAICDE